MEFFAEYSAWFLPIGITAAGFVVGLVVERLLLGRLRRAARETAWEWDDFVVGSLGHAPTLLFTAAGAYVGLLVADYAMAETLNRIMAVLLIVAGTAVAARLVGGLVRYSTSRPGSTLPSSSLLTNLAKVLVYLVGVVIILQNLDIPITPLVTGLGIGGLAVADPVQRVRRFSGARGRAGVAWRLHPAGQRRGRLRAGHQVAEHDPRGPPG